MKTQPDIRKRELAQIHIAKAQLQLDDETYRQMLWTIGRVHSSADLDHAGRRRVIEHLASRGWKNKQKPPKPGKGAAALIEKIEAQLADMRLPWSYAGSMAKQMFKRDRLEWCRPKELLAIVSALAYEQDKRAALVRVDEMLLQLNKTREDVAAMIKLNSPGYRKDWTRDLHMLRFLITRFGQLLADGAANEH